MKKSIFVLAALIVSLASATVFADPDTRGSSTDPDALKQSGNTGKTTYTNIHNEKQINASSKVAHTDAKKDGHPFSNSGTGGGD